MSPQPTGAFSQQILSPMIKWPRCGPCGCSPRTVPRPTYAHRASSSPLSSAKRFFMLPSAFQTPFAMQRRGAILIGRSGRVRGGSCARRGCGCWWAARCRPPPRRCSRWRTGWWTARRATGRPGRPTATTTTSQAAGTGIRADSMRSWTTTRRTSRTRTRCWSTCCETGAPPAGPTGASDFPFPLITPHTP